MKFCQSSRHLALRPRITARAPPVGVRCHRLRHLEPLGGGEEFHRPRVDALVAATAEVDARAPGIPVGDRAVPTAAQ
jgi:hypothetical protein